MNMQILEMNFEWSNGNVLKIYAKAKIKKKVNRKNCIHKQIDTVGKITKNLT